MWQRNYVVLPGGERIRYALSERVDGEGTGYYVRFRAPDGKRVKRSTDSTKKADAVGEAHRIILDEYGQAAAPKPKTLRSTWEEAEERLREEMEADGKRPKTIKGYLETLKKLKGMFPGLRGPSDVTDAEAAQFKTKYSLGKWRGEKPSPKSVDSRLRTLKACFAWFQRSKLIDKNVFEDVSLPKLDRHEVKYVKPDDLDHFDAWLAERWKDWDMPRLFFQVKAMTGCRLGDLCAIRSEQLQDGRIVFPADVTKNRSGRRALLPADVFEALNAYKGPTFLWERYPAELIEENRANGWPVHRQKAEFSPTRLYHWVEGIMQAYQSGTGRDLSSHDFRRAAFTRAAERGIHPKRAAEAFDVTPETMMRNYTATDKKRTADEVLGSLAETLRLNGRREGRAR